MIAKFNELKIGDEIIVPLNSKLIFGKVIRFTKQSVVISTSMDVKKYTYTSGSYTRNYIKRVYRYTPVSEHNATKHVNHYRDFWVMKRDGILMDI